MSRPLAPPASSSATERPTRHRSVWHWRPWLLVAVVLLVIAGALGGTYAWTQSQYFVGHADADVAIYRGVNTEFGPLKFFKVYQLSDLRLADLYPSVRSQVVDGITAGSRAEAESIINNLRNQQLPLCRTASATSTPSAPATTPPATTPPATTPPVTTPTVVTSAPSSAEQGCRR